MYRDTPFLSCSSFTLERQTARKAHERCFVRCRQGGMLQVAVDDDLAVLNDGPEAASQEERGPATDAAAADKVPAVTAAVVSAVAMLALGAHLAW